MPFPGFTPGTVDVPYDRLADLPRELWLGALVTSAGTSARRLADLPRWAKALHAGQLPPAALDFDDATAVEPLRRLIGELDLPGLARGAPAAVQQVLRTMLWHLDRLIDRPAGQPREAAIAQMLDAFRAEWTAQRADWEDVLALLQGLGDLATLPWEALRGRLTSREWREAQRISAVLARLPALRAMIRRLGRGEHRRDTPATATEAEGVPQPARWVETPVPDAPGEMRGVKLGRQLARMVSAEAAALGHPLLKKLWHARLAEGRLRVWDEQGTAAVWQHGLGRAAPQRAAAAPQARERGPFIVCVDTSGSMRGAPENVAKAVVLEALRCAHTERRACRLIGFGGPDEVFQRDLALDAAGLDGLLQFMGQAFDGGTDVATPIEHALSALHAARWRDADLLVVSDGEFGPTPQTLAQLDAARARFGLHVQGVLVGDRETLGLMELCDEIFWVRDWRRHADDTSAPDGFTPVHTKSLTALYFPNALSTRAAKHRPT